MSGTERWNCLRFQEVVAAKAEFFKMFKEAADAAAAAPEYVPEAESEATVEVMSAPVEYTPVRTDSQLSTEINSIHFTQYRSVYI